MSSPYDDVHGIGQLRPGLQTCHLQAQGTVNSATRYAPLSMTHKGVLKSEAAGG